MHGVLAVQAQADRQPVVRQEVRRAIGIHAYLTVASEFLDQAVQAVLSVHTPDHFAYARANQGRRRDGRIVDVTDDDVAAFVHPEVRMLLAFFQQRQSEVCEVAGALRHVVDAVEYGFDSNDGHG